MWEKKSNIPIRNSLFQISTLDIEQGLMKARCRNKIQMFSILIMQRND